MKLNQRLPLAPTWCSVLSFACYVVIWCRGLQHAARVTGWAAVTPFAADEDTLLRDVTNLCILYGVESVLALIGNQSTLSGWRRIDFLLHHLPYSVVVGLATWFGVPIYKAYARTLPLTLLTSANEAITIGYTFGVPRTLDRPNRAYLLCVMVLLIAAELFESGQILLDPTSGADLRWVAVLQLGAPLYHAFGVVPLCWKRLRSVEAAANAGSFDDAALSSPNKKVEKAKRSD